MSVARMRLVQRLHWQLSAGSPAPASPEEVVELRERIQRLEIKTGRATYIRLSKRLFPEKASLTVRHQGACVATEW